MESACRPGRPWPRGPEAKSSEIIDRQESLLTARCAEERIMQKYLSALTVAVCLANVAWAHDTWVQTNTNVVRAGDNVHIDLMLGNHGNDHRDFKLASKIDLAGTTFEVLA